MTAALMHCGSPARCTTRRAGRRPGLRIAQRLCGPPLRAWLVLLGIAAALPALAHKASDAYLQLDAQGATTTLRVDVALRDLDTALDIDADADGRLSWGEVRSAFPAIEAYLLERIDVVGCPARPAIRSLERRSDGVYAAVTLNLQCTLSDEPQIHYRVLRELDPTHRGLVRFQLQGREPTLRMLDPTVGTPQPRPKGQGATPGSDDAAGSTAVGNRASGFLSEGIHHIVTGYDHVLFLLCLLLPSVMRRTDKGWQPVERIAQAVLPVVGIVSAFTMAHSITLALAAMKWVSLPPWFIEPAIAATIVLAAFDNLRPIFRGRRVLVTFLFGLIHGFGFAGVLGELNLQAKQFAWALFQFNVGLELGQIAIVMAVAVLLFVFRGWRHYSSWAIAGGSVAAMLLGVLWFVERTARVTLING